MAKNKIDYVVDIKNKWSFIKEVNQLDDLVLNISLVNNGIPYNLTGQTVIVNYVNANNTIANIGADKVTVNGNRIEVICPTDCTRSCGKASFNLVVKDSEGQVSTFIMDIQINQGLIQNQEQSKNASIIAEDLNNASLLATQKKNELQNVIETADTTTYATKGEINGVKSDLEDIVQQTDYEISDLKEKMKNYISSSNLNSYFGKQIASSSNSLAFPSIAKFNNKLYVAFREGATHTTLDGVIKIRVSENDGKTWSSESFIVLSSDGRDYRDPQLIVFNNKLVLRAFYRTTTSVRHIIFKVSEDGTNWASGIQITPPDGFSYAGASGTMIERNGTLISTAYTYPHACSVFVITTKDLINFNTKLVLDARVQGFGASETTIDYLQGKYRIFCRPSPEDSMDWFVIRTDDNFKLENIQVKKGPLDGPRSLSIDDYNCLLSYRDNSDSRNQKIVITKTDRNGNEYKNILLEHENSTDSGYYDLKRDGDKVYGVFYRKDDSNNYNIHFRLYNFNELISFEVSTKNIIDTSTGKNYIGKLLKGNKTYTHNVDIKDFTINIPTTTQVSKILNTSLTLRTDDTTNVFIVNITNITINDNSIDLSVRVLNPKSTVNNARNIIYYDVTYI